jgi:hypothetical protein
LDETGKNRDETGKGRAAPSFEPDDFPIGKVLLVIIGIGIFIALLTLIATQLVTVWGRDSVYVKELSVVDPRLAETRANDKQELTTYKVLDAQKSWYRIPISLSMQLMAEHPELISPIKPPAESSPAPEPPAASPKPAKKTKSP